MLAERREGGNQKRAGTALTICHHQDLSDRARRDGTLDRRGYQMELTIIEAKASKAAGRNDT
eukprot:5179622-Prymnesium_polylepis.1